MAIFKFTESNGNVHVGIPMGTGGRLGGGASHCGLERENKAAERLVRIAIESGEQSQAIWPHTIGDVPHEIFQTHIKRIDLRNAKVSIMNYKEAEPYAIVGEPYPRLN
jgi:hypothetical protein